MKFKIHTNKTNKLIITDPLSPTGRRAGQYFISFPEDLSQKLPGSVMLPEVFLAKHHVNNVTPKTLLSEKISTNAKPLLTIKDGDCLVNIFHGSFNKHALNLGLLASKGFSEPLARANYQKSIYKLLTPIFEHASKDNSYDYWIVEDCLASGDTLIGVLNLLTKKHKIQKVRIDVVVATTIGIDLILQSFKSLDISFTLNIGFLAYGLSEGKKEGSVRMHANYIIYPDKLMQENNKVINIKIEKNRSPDGNIYVVGDMGDGAKSMNNSFDNKFPWNLYRNDNHGEHKNTKVEKYKNEAPRVDTFGIYEYGGSGIPPKQKHLPVRQAGSSTALQPWSSAEGDKKIEKANTTKILYFSNGGYLLKAYVNHLKLNKNMREVVISAKRIWSPDHKYGYGVLLDGI